MTTDHQVDQSDRPNVVLILADDMGYSDLGCFGSEIDTPHLDALAANGVRMAQFYNTARCTPSRASLLTGLHPHQTGIGVLTRNDGPGGYPGTMNDRCVTLAEVLSDAGYATNMSGKWHLTGQINQPDRSWPSSRGFQHSYGIVTGASSYYEPHTLTEDDQPATTGDDFYLTTELGERAAGFVRSHTKAAQEEPFFLYLPFTAPHWPLHAPQDAIARQAGRYDEGWDEVRRRRFQRQRDAGLLAGNQQLSERDDDMPGWQETADQAWQARRMEVNAAQVELMDAAIGRLVEALAETGQLRGTLIIFLSDNGGCAEEMPPGFVDELPNRPRHAPASTRSGQRVRRGNAPEIEPGPADTYSSYGRPWANVSNTPFREYKHWVHEGGIATPLIAHWPQRLTEPLITQQPHQLTDVMATVLEVTGAGYPNQRDGVPIPACEGASMLPAWQVGPRKATQIACCIGNTKGTARFARAGGNSSANTGRPGNSTISMPTGPNKLIMPRSVRSWSIGSRRRTRAGPKGAACCPASRCWPPTPTRFKDRTWLMVDTCRPVGSDGYRGQRLAGRPDRRATSGRSSASRPARSRPK